MFLNSHPPNSVLQFTAYAKGEENTYRSVRLRSSIGRASNPSGKGSRGASSSSLSSSLETDEAAEGASGTSGIVSSVCNFERGLEVDGSKREKERAPLSPGLSGEEDRREGDEELDGSGTIIWSMLLSAIGKGMISETKRWEGN